MTAILEKNCKSRGTTLFEEFERILPYLSRFDERGDHEFIKAIQILLDHFNLSQSETERGKNFQAQPIVANLRTLLNDYLQRTMTIPSAIFVVMAYMESTSLDDEDAALVHKLTRLHVERARSMKQSKDNPAGAAQTSTWSSGKRQSQKNALLAALTSGGRAAKVLLRHA